MSKPLTTRQKLRIAQAVFLSFGAALMLFIQLFMFPLAGKKVTDNSALYAYQLDTWANEVYERLEKIASTSPYNEIDLSRERAITPEYINNVALFHAQMLQVLRILSYQGRVIVAVSGDMAILMGSAGDSLDKKNREELKSGIRLLGAAAERHGKIQAEIEAFNRQLREAYSPEAEHSAGGDVDADVERRVRQIRLLTSLFRKPELLLAPGHDPLVFLKEFGQSQALVFKAYSSLVTEHNRRVGNHEFYRDLLQLLIALLTACLMLNVELKAHHVGAAAAKSKRRRTRR